MKILFYTILLSGLCGLIGIISQDPLRIEKYQFDSRSEIEEKLDYVDYVLSNPNEQQHNNYEEYSIYDEEDLSVQRDLSYEKLHDDQIPDEVALRLYTAEY